MDANEYALQMSPSNKALGLVIRKAGPMLKAKKRTNSEPSQIEKKLNQEEKDIPSLAVELPEPTSQVQPKAPIEIDAQINEREIKMMFGDRHYRVRGLNKNLTYDQLKVKKIIGQSFIGSYSNLGYTQFHQDKKYFW